MQLSLQYKLKCLKSNKQTESQTDRRTDIFASLTDFCFIFYGYERFLFCDVACCLACFCCFFLLLLLWLQWLYLLAGRHICCLWLQILSDGEKKVKHKTKSTHIQLLTPYTSKQLRTACNITAILGCINSRCNAVLTLFGHMLFNFFSTFNFLAFPTPVSTWFCNYRNVTLLIRI